MPLELNTQPVRPQNRPFQWFGTVIVTLWPTGSTQPVADSGTLASGEAAAQMVWPVRLTKVTRRAPDERGPAVGVTGDDAWTDGGTVCDTARGGAVVAAGGLAVGDWPAVTAVAGGVARG